MQNKDDTHRKARQAVRTAIKQYKTWESRIEANTTNDNGSHGVKAKHTEDGLPLKELINVRNEQYKLLAQSLENKKNKERAET